MPLKQAVALALTCAVPVAARPDRPHTSSEAQAGPLTPREREVATLIVRGLSNRQIAERLVITDRTVAAHVEHILDKLGFTSRTQIGVWASEHGLVASSFA